MKIPSLVLKQLYTYGSLENTADGVIFGLKNRLSDAVVTGIEQITIDDRAVPLENLQFSMGDTTFSPAQVSADNPITFPLSKIMMVLWKGESLDIGKTCRICLLHNNTPANIPGPGSLDGHPFDILKRRPDNAYR